MASATFRSKVFRKTDQEVRRAFTKLQAQGDKEKNKLTGLVLDLRNDPGGLLDQAIAVTDLFVDEGGLSPHGVVTISREARAQPGDTLPYLPMVTLINEGTASAAEIVAGALQDLKRSPLLGTQSFGKGSVQNIDLEDGSALKITIARYFTPNGRPIQNVGNTPDMYVSSQSTAVQEIDMIREKDLQNRIGNHG
ncbi:MAG: S41 family peptidase [Bdellovibrionota bacterium]